MAERLDPGRFWGMLILEAVARRARTDRVDVDTHDIAIELELTAEQLEIGIRWCQAQGFCSLDDGRQTVSH